jgi:hypothetical protein
MVSTAVRIYTSIDQRRSVAEQEFFALADKATSAGVLGFMDEVFQETIMDALAESKTLEGVIITGPNGEYAFEKVRGAAVNWVNDSPRFKNRFDFSRQPLFQPLRIQGLRNANIQAVAGALDYGLLSAILKQALLMVLAALALAFFTLLVETLAGGANRRSYPGPDLGDYSHPINPKPQAPSVARTAPQSDAPAGAVPAGAAPDIKQPAVRLDLELNRCAAADQDLVFIKMECKGGVDSGFRGQLIAEAPQFFALRGLIFKRGERGVDLIYPNIDLETGFARMEEFHHYLLNKYPDILVSPTGLCMGLSSRAGRVIDSERLMFEAGEALERALYDPVSPIVAFKSDPEKYQAYINRKP